MGIYGTWCWTRPIQTIASKMICMLKTCAKFCHFIFPTSKTRLSRKLQTPRLFLWQYCTLTLETVNLLKPSGIRYFVLLSLPYPMLGIRYWPLNFLLTLLSIPFGLRQLGYMKKSLPVNFTVKKIYVWTKTQVEINKALLIRKLFYTEHKRILLLTKKLKLIH